ncbi:hypothetical protein [Novosphingobium colocasiae]|uniref:hypothetical protein n=1 Tax=Novosphingobium colocasiae TaxID=1256513 RepID=UPI0035AF1499
MTSDVETRNAQRHRFSTSLDTNGNCGADKSTMLWLFGHATEGRVAIQSGLSRPGLPHPLRDRSDER